MSGSGMSGTALFRKGAVLLHCFPKKKKILKAR